MDVGFVSSFDTFDLLSTGVAQDDICNGWRGLRSVSLRDRS
jgi:hypothetical protein